MLTNKDLYIMHTVIRPNIIHQDYDSNFRLSAALFVSKMCFIGHNQKKTHPLMAKYHTHPEVIELHAEIDAIRRALRLHSIDDLSKSTLYVGRLKYDSPKKKKTIWGMALPCSKVCMPTIIAFDIPRIVYSTDNQTFEELLING